VITEPQPFPDAPALNTTSLPANVQPHLGDLGTSKSDQLSEEHGAGVLLIERKRRLKHGQWLPWLEKNFEGGRTTAFRYIKLAEEWLANVPSAEHLDPPSKTPSRLPSRLRKSPQTTLLSLAHWTEEDIEEDIRKGARRMPRPSDDAHGHTPFMVA
jgi:hypothetical protein